MSELTSESGFRQKIYLTLFFMEREIIFRKIMIYAKFFIFLNSSRRDEFNHMSQFFIQ